MKNLVLLLSCMTICFISFGQAKPVEKPKTIKSEPAVKPAAGKSEATYIMVLSEIDLRRLFEFMANADDYTDKGRQKFLTEYQKKVYVAPPDPTTDSTASKPK